MATASTLSRAGTSLAITLAVLVIACLCAAAVVAATKPKTAAKVSTKDLFTTAAAAPPPLRNWAVIGAGIAAASFVNTLTASERGGVVVYEADARVGGRALSVPQPAVAVSTHSSPREFAAWLFDPLQHSFTTALLRDVGMPMVKVELRTAKTVLWTPEHGAQPFEELNLPAHIPETMTFAELVAASKQDKNVWYAHTGMWVDDCPRAAADIVARFDLPVFAFAPSGFGWQDVTLRAIGATPIVYDRVLERVDVNVGGSGSNTDTDTDTDRVTLTFASGEVITVAGAVLTVPPPAMGRMQGLPQAFRAALSDTFTEVSVGVMYATWATADVWWRGSAAYADAGCIATTLPLGRMYIVSTNDVRCTMSGVRDVDFWSKMMLSPDPGAIRAEVAAQISRVLGAGSKVALPAAVAFRAWPNAVALWNASSTRAQKRDALTWPFGRRAPVVWASSDVSDFPGWVEGAVQAGASAARRV